MNTRTVLMHERKAIALVAHDHRKRDLLEWARFNRVRLSRHHLYGTGTTGGMIARELDLPVKSFRSGPLGGDLEIGARIAALKIDMMIFFWDPLEAQPHDVDVKALLRVAVLYNVPTATNRATADFLISSHLFDETYERELLDYGARLRGFASAD